MIARIAGQGRGLCYLPKPKTEANNTNRGFDNHAKTKSNNCFTDRSFLKTRLRL